MAAKKINPAMLACFARMILKLIEKHIKNNFLLTLNWSTTLINSFKFYKIALYKKNPTD